MTPRALARAAGFFVLRTPLLPFDDLLASSEGLTAASLVEDEVALEAALARDRERVRAHLRLLLERPEVREAIFVASPSLDERLATWREAPDGENGLKVEGALLRYLARMTGRATPFGLFAGCSLGTLGPSTRFELAPRAAYARHTRLDMDYVCALADALTRTPDVRAPLLYRPNSSLYRAAGRHRYVEARLGGADGRTRSHHLVALESSPYLEATLERCRSGAHLGALAAALVEDDAEVTREEAEDYVAELARAQVLVPDLAPAVTGPEPALALVPLLRDAGAGGALAAERLLETGAALAAMDAGGLGAPPERYRELRRGLESLPVEPELARLFQIDMTKPGAHLTLGTRVVDELLRAVEILRRISPAGDDLATFREAFVERWGRREIPLAEALDEDIGVGFGASAGGTDGPLLEALAFPGPPRAGDLFSPKHEHLLRRLDGVLRAGERELVLTEADVAALANDAPSPLPDGLAVLATLSARSGAAADRGEFRVVVRGVSTPSGANLLGRFSHADPAIAEAVAALVHDEESLRPDAVCAEVVHLPKGRVGNVLLRPLLRSHEIAYLARSGAPLERQLSIDDLRVSVVADRIVLRSVRLDREIVPRVTTAHNYAVGCVGLYRFLGALQHQGHAALGFDWGPLGAAPFLPRVVCGRVVLASARWRLGARDLEPLGKLRGAHLFRAIQRLRSDAKLPRHVAVSDGDSLLPVDLDNVLSVEAFAQVSKGRDQVTVVEMNPTPEELCVRGPEGRFVHELVVPFVRTATPAPAPVPRGPRSEPLLVRAFAPGSEWLYAKLYCGAAAADEVLAQLVAPLVARGRESGAIDRWFFLRYADPGWHLRVRLHGPRDRLVAEVLPSLHDAASPLLGRGLLSRLELGTYERELERYGGDEGMLLAEQVFEADSDAALGIVADLEGDAAAEARWRLAFSSMARLFEDLAIEPAPLRGLVARARASYGQELRVDATLRRQLGELHRKRRDHLEALLDGRDCGVELGRGRELLAERSRRIAPVCAALREAEARGRLGAPLVELASSYAHMAANRLLRGAARAHELVIYDALERILAARAARP